MDMLQRSGYDLAQAMAKLVPQGDPETPQTFLRTPLRALPVHPSAPSTPRFSQFHAMDTLQRNGYDLARAMATLVPQGGPVLCRDEMEEWSASEAMLFEEALEKYGKDFNDIRQDFVSGG